MCLGILYGSKLKTWNFTNQQKGAFLVYSAVRLTFNLNFIYLFIQVNSKQSDISSNKSPEHLTLLGCAEKNTKNIGSKGWQIFVLKIHIGKHQNTQESIRLVLNNREVKPPMLLIALTPFVVAYLGVSQKC